LRYIDVANDVAFLAMDFDYQGRPDELGQRSAQERPDRKGQASQCSPNPMAFAPETYLR
jgi:aminoglycoside phosphotransferase family enzyme